MQKQPEKKKKGGYVAGNKKKTGSTLYLSTMPYYGHSWVP